MITSETWHTVPNLRVEQHMVGRVCVRAIRNSVLTHALSLAGVVFSFYAGS